MSDRDDPVAERLARLQRETQNIQPSHGFEARVFAAVAAEVALNRPGADWQSETRRGARKLVPFIAAVALFAVLWAVQSESSLDEVLVVYDAPSEIEW